MNTDYPCVKIRNGENCKNRNRAVKSIYDRDLEPEGLVPCNRCLWFDIRQDFFVAREEDKTVQEAREATKIGGEIWTEK